MKEKYAYLLKSDREITAHLTSIQADNFRERVDTDISNFCFETIASGNIDLMNRIIIRHPNLFTHINTHRDSFGNTALRVAAWNNHIEMVEFLISHGADDRRENGHMTALELIFLHSETRSTPRTKKIIMLLLEKVNPTEVNTLLDFLSQDHTNYPGAYEELLPIVQEFRIQEQFPDEAIEELKIIYKELTIPFDEQTIKLIESLIEEIIPEDLDTYLDSLQRTSPNIHNALLSLIQNFRFRQVIDELLESTDSPIVSSEDDLNLRIKIPNNNQIDAEEEYKSDSSSEDGEFPPAKHARMGTPEIHHQLYGEAFTMPPLANHTASLYDSPSPSNFSGEMHIYHDS